LGTSVAAGPDFTGDGVPDLVFGAYTADGETEAGARLIDAGRIQFVSGGNIGTSGSSLLSSFYGKEHGAYLGQSAAVIGDVNGDGLSEILVGAPNANEGFQQAGKVYLIAGRSSWDDSPVMELASWRGLSELSEFGKRVAPAGDLNGDGLADFLMTGEIKHLVSGSERYREGTVFLVYGRSEGWTLDEFADSADASFTGERTDEAAGLALASGSDLNGDGHADLVIGAPYGASGKRGRFYAIAGSATPPTEASALDDTIPHADGEYAYDTFAWSLATGDLNGDGIADLAVGAPLSNTPYSNAGAVYLFAGGADFFVADPEPFAIIRGDWDDMELGTGLASGGDFNADGAQDLVVGAVKTYRGLATKSGKYYLINGRTSGWEWESSISSATIGIHGVSTNDFFGTTAAFMDLNGDERSELVMGSGLADLDDDADLGAVYLFWGQP